MKHTINAHSSQVRGFIISGLALVDPTTPTLGSSPHLILSSFHPPYPYFPLAFIQLLRCLKALYGGAS